MAATRSPPSDRPRTQPTPQTSDRSVPTLGRRSSRKNSQPRPRSTSRKLSKANAPSIRNSEKVESVPPIPALPEQRRIELSEKGGLNRSNQQASSPTQHRGDIPSYYFQNPMSDSSLQPEKFTVVREPPTLQNKRSANDHGILRGKSSKKKANDHAREQEIRAMSSPVPIPKRPKSYQTDILARDSRKIPGGLNSKLERPTSDVSLPLPESMHSQLSVASDQHAFKVSAFDALSPRPTIRYSGNPRSPAGSLGPSRTSTRKDKQPMIPEEPSAKSRKRIDDLADDMDAGSIRELMERDQRRHEKHRRSEQEKLQRRLERKAAKQRQQEARPENGACGGVDQGRGEREDVGLGLEEKTGAPKGLAAPSRGEGTRTPESWLKDPSKEQLPIKNPFHDPVEGATTSHLEEFTPTEEREEPVLETAKAVRLSSASMSPPTSPLRQAHDPRHTHELSNLSQFSELASSSTPDIPEKQEIDHRRDSDTVGRFSSSWKSVFRRSDTRAKRESADRGRSDRGRATPSEFSNTSRESVARSMPPVAFQSQRLGRVRSGTPIRSQSIFREDLPEIPNSPPESRIQSPEPPGKISLSNIPGSRGTDVIGAPSEPPLSEIHPAYREEVALSRNASLRAKSAEEPQSAAISESLASVDAEGSWLTGKPVKRLSTPQALRDSQNLDKPGEDSEDSVPGTPEAEKYMGTLTPAPSDRQSEEPPLIPQRRRPYMGPNSDDSSHPSNPASIPITQEEGTTWHPTLGKHPTIVRQGPGPRAKSREGLLNDFRSDATESPPVVVEDAAQSQEESSPSETSPVSLPPEGPIIERATSVELGKGHARHISAGSARLLNLPPRNSTEIKRFSSGSGYSGISGGERSPLAQSPRLPQTKDDDDDDDVN
ncbi:MAG: hypothetical protein Q9164_004173 [Protoblastenia rupestris]